MFCKLMRCARKARYKRESSERVVRCRGASDSCLCRLDNTEVGDQRGLPLRAQLPRSQRQLTGRPVKVRRLLSRERGLVRKGTVSTRDGRVGWGDSRKAKTLGQALRFESGERADVPYLFSTGASSCSVKEERDESVVLALMVPRPVSLALDAFRAWCICADRQKERRQQPATTLLLRAEHTFSPKS